MDVSKRPKLFRAIVVMGAAMTSAAAVASCDSGEDCCAPKKDAAVASSDAGVDASTSMTDAPVDVVLIL